MTRGRASRQDANAQSIHPSMPPLTVSATSTARARHRPAKRPSNSARATSPQAPERQRPAPAQQVTYAEKFRVAATFTAPGPGTWMSGVSSVWSNGP